MSSVVVIGGGTGSYTLLRGLKKYTNDITAIVSMFDSGGSTGRLRDEFGYLPPGDVRRCILALTPEKSDTDVLRSLLDFRFKKGEGLNGHSMGNLLLTALKEITQDEILAIEKLSSLLGLKGRVLPVTLDNSHLCAELEDGTIVKGETNIDIPKHDPKLRIKKLFLEPNANALIDTIESIKNSDLVVIGPGDLYSSLIPNLLVRGISDAIKSSKAKKVYVCNVMTKYGETHGFKASDFLNELEKYLGKGTIQYMICNTEKGTNELLKIYAEENAFPVELDEQELINRVNLIKGDFINEGVLVRHDSRKLARTIIDLKQNE